MKIEFFENLVLYLGCRLNEPSAGIMRFDIDSSLFIYIYICCSDALDEEKIVYKSYSLPRPSIAVFYS